MADDPRADEQEALSGSPATRTSEPDELDRASENVLEGWPTAPAQRPPEVEGAGTDADGDGDGDGDGVEARRLDAPLAVEPSAESPEETRVEMSTEHAPGSLAVPPGYPLLEGEPVGGRRAVGVVVSRFNGDITSRLLRSALDELAERGVEQSSITVMPVPGAFELPLAAMALAKTRRFACVVALGCVIRGDTHHFGYIAGEAASGLQLAAIETGVPVSFGVLTLERLDQAEARIDKGAEAVRTALEMADLFANLRAAAAR